MKTVAKVLFVLSVLSVVLTTIFAWFSLYWQVAPV